MQFDQKVDFLSFSATFNCIFSLRLLKWILWGFYWEAINYFLYFIIAFCSAKIVIHLHASSANKEPGPYQHSKYSFIKLSFKEHGQIEVVPFTSQINFIMLLFAHIEIYI